jgi:hypothetical protein
MGSPVERHLAGVTTWVDSPMFFWDGTHSYEIRKIRSASSVVFSGQAAPESCRSLQSGNNWPVKVFQAVSSLVGILTSDISKLES